MKKLHLKLWILLPIIFILSLFFYSLFRHREYLFGGILGTQSNNIEEKVVEELSPEPIVQDYMGKKSGETIVRVPYYWKFGIKNDNTDYLQGYIPSIRNFREYFETHREIYSGNKNLKHPLNDTSSSPIKIDSEYVFSNGIINHSSFFQWDENSCDVVFSQILENNLFLCSNWLNWFNIKSEDKTFVLTECIIEEEVGFCVFQDYLNTYYEMVAFGENRCFGDENSSKFCDYEKYIELIEFN